MTESSQRIFHAQLLRANGSDSERVLFELGNCSEFIPALVVQAFAFVRYVRGISSRIPRKQKIFSWNYCSNDLESYVQWCINFHK